ncbi:hypothetical protein SCHPADRAFT_263183 [Schizopora paradoxa]|uniref:F-box domain-containing protein n=1 Tax=Schizopora paradoxa TaxID=27342 RepID=A0A0H2RV73_9AGAM|nr:hypothetical protein SCHPADRAFT_263183 [Schizopora paradoxa]
MLSLPSETLHSIFENLIKSVVPEEYLSTAIALSHVCRSFRQVAVHCPELWTCLKRKSSCIELDAVETCIERSRDRPLDVAFSLHPHSTLGQDYLPSTMAGDTVVQALLSTNKRWRRCTIYLCGEEPSSCDATDDKLVPFHFQTTSSGVDAPILEHLSFLAHPSLTRLIANGPRKLDEFSPISNWVIPNLRSVTIQNALSSSIPSKFRAQLTDLEVRVVGPDVNVHSRICDILEFGIGTTSVSTLRLSFNGCRFNPAAYPRPKAGMFSSVRSLYIEILNCIQPGPYDNLSTLRRSFSGFGLRMKGVVELRITFDVGNSGEENNLIRWRGLISTLHSLLHAGRYTVLEILDVTILGRNQQENANSSHDEQENIPVVLLPHCCIPSIKNLRIETALDLSIVGDVGDTSISDSEDLELLFIKREEVLRPISLETVTLTVSKVKGFVPWVRQLVSKMRETSCWNRFSKLTMVRNGEQEVIPRDDVELWCDDAINS